MISASPVRIATALSCAVLSGLAFAAPPDWVMRNPRILEYQPPTVIELQDSLLICWHENTYDTWRRWYVLKVSKTGNPPPVELTDERLCEYAH